MSAENEFQMRPGVALRWSEGRFKPAEIADLAGDWLMLFSLVESGGTMRLLRREHFAEPEGRADSAAFHVALLLSEAALNDLLVAGKPTRLAEAEESSGGLALPLSPGARLAAESIRRCPFGGPFRQMAYSARSNDLLLEFFSALAVPETARPAVMRTLERQTRAAAELLGQRLEDPPSLAALARQVGLSESTLKRGFHEIFGTTVFGYLRERRMEQARDLLQNGEATVLEAAARVGYSNPSNFAAAFRRQFGVNPKAFQLRRKPEGGEPPAAG